MLSAWSWYGVPRALLKEPLASAPARAAQQSPALAIALATMEHPQVADFAAGEQAVRASAQSVPGDALAKLVAAGAVLDCLPVVADSAVATGAIADPASATGSHSENALGPALCPAPGLAPMWTAADLAMGLLAGSALATSPAAALALACLAVHGCQETGRGPRAADAGTAPEAPAPAAAARVAGPSPGLAAAAAMRLRACLRPGLEPDRRSAIVLAQH